MTGGPGFANGEEPGYDDMDVRRGSRSQFPHRIVSSATAAQLQPSLSAWISWATPPPPAGIQSLCPPSSRSARVASACHNTARSRTVGAVTVEVSTHAVTQVIRDAIAQAQGMQAESREPSASWLPRLQSLYQGPRLTYWPVLCVTLVARAASPDVDVRRIQKKDRADAYAAATVGQVLVRTANAAEVDMRTDSSNVLNSQPFTFKPLITPDLTDDASYPKFYEMVSDVQLLDQDEAKEVLATAFLVGLRGWPARRRRGQKRAAATNVAASDASYFVLNQSPHQDFAHYDGTDGADEDYYGFHANVTSAKALVEAGGGDFVFYRTSDAREHPMTFVGAGHIDRVDETGNDAEGRRTWRARVNRYTAFTVPVPKAEGAFPGWNSQHSIVRINKDTFDRIVRLGEGKEHVRPLTAQDLQERCDEQGLLLPPSALVAMVAAVNAGKHLILTGPPGTAKTTVAVVLADLAAERGHSSGALLTTATSDWSTYDTIGGLRPSAREPGRLEFNPGHFTEAVDQRRWLVVDEMNRANFDRAFGQLFTVLAGQSVVLPYRDAATGKPVRFRVAAEEPDPEYHDVVVGETWRMVGTLNNFDKSLLYEMSFALMRRFAFVEVPAPETDVFRILIRKQVADCPLELGSRVENVVGAFLPLRDLKDLGPALFIDAARYARELLGSGSLEDAEAALLVFHGMLLPQFEGIDETTGRRLLRHLLKAAPGHRETATRMLRDVLGLQLATQADLDADDDAADQLLEDLPADWQP